MTVAPWRAPTMPRRVTRQATAPALGRTVAQVLAEEARRLPSRETYERKLRQLGLAPPDGWQIRRGGSAPAQPEAAAGRKRGRPKADDTPNVYLNPRFARFQAALLLESTLYDGIQRVATGARRSVESDRVDAREQLLILAPRLKADLGVNLRDFRRRAKSLTLLAPARSRQRFAGELTGQLLGYGRYWFRDLLRSAPKEWLPGKRRRFGTDLQISSERAAHPRRFDRFTRAERLFYRLPPDARTAIELAVRNLVGWGPVLSPAKDIEAALYLLSCAENREEVAPPKGLRGVVWTAIKGLPLKMHREVNALTIHPGPYKVTPLPALGPVRQWDRKSRVAKRGKWGTPAPIQSEAGIFERLCSELRGGPLRERELLRRLADCHDAREVLREAKESGEIVQAAPADDEDDRLALAPPA
jgi:hypothetical protein